MILQLKAKKSDPNVVSALRKYGNMTLFKDSAIREW